ncbi:hypothetical protein V8E54_009875 [Elaphomyces granulatus]
MVALLGPPPLEFLKRSNESLKYWDENGEPNRSYQDPTRNWKGSVPIPDQSLESRESQLEGKNKELFLQFLRKILCWLPEERPTAQELLFDKWVIGDEY